MPDKRSPLSQYKTIVAMIMIDKVGTVSVKNMEAICLCSYKNAGTTEGIILPISRRPSPARVRDSGPSPHVSEERSPDLYSPPKCLSMPYPSK